MIEQERITSGCLQLVQRLREQGCEVSETVWQAFANVPRHAFVSYYYQPVATRAGREWRRMDEASDPQWDEHIYSPTSLTTRLDRDGLPMSSSSNPAIMAPMLDYLEVERGQRVLEIGTGTGYNAALLTYLVGDPGLITTIDIDEGIIAEARTSLKRAVGPGMTVVAGDGAQGYTTRAPFDRIIATASVPCVPEAWYQQLAPGGVLVCTLQPLLAACGGLLKAVKDPETLQLRGQITRIASFLPVHQGERHHRHTISLESRALASFPLESHQLDVTLPALFQNYDFHFFLYQALPHFNVIQAQDAAGPRFIISTEPEREGYVVLAASEDGYRVELHGPDSYAQWNQLVQVYTLFRASGKPRLIDYHFEMDQSGQRLSFHYGQSLFYPFTR